STSLLRGGELSRLSMKNFTLNSRFFYRPGARLLSYWFIGISSGLFRAAGKIHQNTEKSAFRKC
ncbi:MAG: hypothetical protein LBM64_09155, partial [Deltaproteobacteria bacterium]|nr:hypothetical protein [Deltaproteobacteria bacterium]